MCLKINTHFCDIVDAEIDVILVDKNRDNQVKNNEENMGQADAIKDTEVSVQNGKHEKSRGLLYKVFSSLISLVRGRKYYMKYDVSLAGIGLACLYFTVLGFDNITIGL